MNKRGFTLVELLAVIAILAVLVIIALPNVMGLFNNIKKESFTTEAKNIISAGEQKWMADNINNPGEKTYCRPIGSDCDDALDLTGRDNINYYIKYDTRGNVVEYYIEDEVYQYSYEGTGLKTEDIKSSTDVVNKEEESESILPNVNPAINGAVAIQGYEIAAKMKSLANNSSVDYTYEDSNIIAFVRSTVPPSDENREEINKITTEESSKEGYIWYDNGTIYWWTQTGTLVLNELANHMFYNVLNLEDIDSVRYFITSKAKKFKSFFCNNKKIVNYDAIKDWDMSSAKDISYLFFDTNITNTDAVTNWDISNVSNMEYIFYECGQLVDISGLSNWDTSNVSNMKYIFYKCEQLVDISSLSNWKTSKLENMKSMFNNCSSLTDITSLSNWDTSNVLDMSSLFWNTFSLTNFTGLENWITSKVSSMAYTFGMTAGKSKTGNPVIDFTPIKDWDTSSVTSMSIMFQNVNIKSYEVFSNWDVSKVTTFYNTFNQTPKSTTTTLHGLENWDVSSATTFDSMFWDNKKLNDASAINDWDINPNANFNTMFKNTPVHPEFTKVSGTWQTNGTFVPNN